MDAIESNVRKILDQWNVDCKKQGINKEFVLNVKCRIKKFYVTRTKFYERNIAEISLLVTGDESYVLWGKQLVMPDKVKNTPTYTVHASYTKMLFFYFLYECIGQFCVVTQQFIKTKDIAEYDVEKDRIKQDSSANKDMIVKTIKGGDFYEEGDEFDVFMVTDDAYFVYTAHDIGLKNNGVAKIMKEDIMVVELGIQKILSLSDVSS